MKISIAMATYNGEQYIQEQLQSFLDQTRRPDELIITDDCSSDRTEDIVREFSNTAPFLVKYYRNEENLGYTGNFNEALMRTAGDLVFLCDQDDVWFPQKIEEMLVFSKNNPNALMMMNDAALTDSMLNEVGLTKIGQIQSAGYDLSRFVMGCCCLIRRELLDFCLPIPAEFRGHDDWLVKFSYELDARAINPSILQYYRRHESNESKFLANSLTKITRFQRHLHTVKSLFTRDAASKIRRDLDKTIMFKKGASRAQKLAAKHNIEALRQFEQRCRAQIPFLERRLDVLTKSFFPRIAAIVSDFIRGRYTSTRGFRSLMEDVIG